MPGRGLRLGPSCGRRKLPRLCRKLRLMWQRSGLRVSIEYAEPHRCDNRQDRHQDRHLSHGRVPSCSYDRLEDLSSIPNGRKAERFHGKIRDFRGTLQNFGLCPLPRSHRSTPAPKRCFWVLKQIEWGRYPRHSSAINHLQQWTFTTTADAHMVIVILARLDLLTREQVPHRNPEPAIAGRESNPNCRSRLLDTMNARALGWRQALLLQ
jgi:hypothetical protein